MSKKTDESPDWDPKPHERRWFTNHQTGDRAYLVRRGGKDCIRLDRPQQEIVRPLRTGEWDEDLDVRPLIVSQVARIAFAADAEFRKSLGMYGEAKLWDDLSERDRVAWLQGKGPQQKDRQKLFRAIWGSISELAK